MPEWRQPISVVAMVRQLRCSQLCYLSLFVLIFTIWCAAAIAAAKAADSASPRIYIVKAAIEHHGEQTCFNIMSTGKLFAEVFSVSGPDRIVVDAVDAAFRMSRRPPRLAAGRVEAFRYGQVGPRHARIVVDVASGTQLGRVESRLLPGKIHQLSISLTNGPASKNSDPCGVSVVKQESERLREQQVAIKPSRPLGREKPVVVVDPGHGGVDPGAVANKVFLEKIIALAVGRRLAVRLRKSGQFNVVLTRDQDVFVSLDDRVEQSRAKNADLFISLHADSIEGGAKAAQAQGAAVYILSHKASDAEAKRLADKENSADLLAGVLPKRGRGDEGVRSILVDLLKRETEKRSAHFQKLLVASMRAMVPVSRKPFRSAAFRVLKQTETPAALIELGYMTNPSDLKRMRQAGWQDRMAAAIAAAIGKYFEQR